MPPASPRLQRLGELRGAARRRWDGWWGAGEGPWYRRRRVWATLATGTAAALVLFVGVGFAWFYASGDIPSPDELRVSEPTVVLDAFGEPIATLDPAAVRENVELSSLPDHVAQAVMAAEDQGFTDHAGFSVRGIARALWQNVTTGSIQQGGSTISQQYVEIAIEEVARNPIGKLREIALAVKLERSLDKDEILEGYLNAVPWGRGAIGIEAAAQTYYAIPAAELDVNQAATLAAIIRAPTALSPVGNPDGADVRRERVLEQMAQLGWLDAQEAQRAIEAGMPAVSRDPVADTGAAAYYLDAVRRRATEVLPEGEDPFLDLEIHTAFNPQFQDMAVRSLGETLDGTPYTGALVSIDPANGAVRALVGGLDFEQQQFNVAVQGPRPAGSSFKPFTLTRFVADGWHPDRTHYRAPREYPVGNDIIHNYTGRGHGVVSVREATVDSINTAYVQLAEDLGLGEVIDTAHDLGIDSELPEVASVTLGAGSVTPLEMASAYATLAAEGVARDPWLIERIVDHTGEVVYARDAGEDQVIEANAAAVVSDVLQDVVTRGTGRAAVIGRPVAGKTGTTNDYKDAWFVGYVPQLATSVWVGNLDNSPMDRVTGGSLPAQAWAAFNQLALEGAEPVPFPAPDFGPLEEFDASDIDVDDDTSPSPTDSPSPTNEPSPSPSPSPEPTEPSPSPTGGESPSPTPSPTDDGGGDAGGDDGDDGPLPVDPSPSPTQEPSPEPSPTEDSSPEPEPSPTEDSSPEPEPSPTEDSSPQPSPSPTDDGSTLASPATLGTTWPGGSAGITPFLAALALAAARRRR